MLSNLKIKEFRQAANLSQQELANAMEVDRTTVSCWERGVSMPRADQIPKIADLLGVTIDALFGREPVQDGQNTA